MGEAALFLLSAALPARPTANDAFLHVLDDTTTPKVVAAETLIPAIYYWQVEQGKTPAKGVIACHQLTEHRVLNQVSFPVVVVSCESGIRMSLTGIDLTGHPQ